MGQAVANTAIMPTALVAVEQSFPGSQRIVDDSLAFRMLPFGAKMFVRLLRSRLIRDWFIGMSERSNPGIWGGLLCRKRYIDEKVVAFRSEIDGLVNLGAGFDTRVFRLPDLSDLPIWEIDQRENIKAKEKRLRKALGSIPANIKLVAVDFDRDGLGPVLTSNGYFSGARVFFLWEAVTQYLTEQGVRATFAWLGHARPGSRITFSYVRKGFLTGRTLYGWEAGYKRFVATGLWTFGMEPEDCAAFLQGYGWRVIEDVGYDELASRYVDPVHRNLTSTPVERMVYAEKT